MSAAAPAPAPVTGAKKDDVVGLSLAIMRAGLEQWRRDAATISAPERARSSAMLAASIFLILRLGRASYPLLHTFSRWLLEWTPGDDAERSREATLSRLHVGNALFNAAQVLVDVELRAAFNPARPSILPGPELALLKSFGADWEGVLLEMAEAEVPSSAAPDLVAMMGELFGKGAHNG